MCIWKPLLRRGKAAGEDLWGNVAHEEERLKQMFPLSATSPWLVTPTLYAAALQ